MMKSFKKRDQKDWNIVNRGINLESEFERNEDSLNINTEKKKPTNKQTNQPINQPTNKQKTNKQKSNKTNKHIRLINKQSCLRESHTYHVVV